MDKFEATGLKPAYHNGHIYVDEAETVIICKKVAFRILTLRALLIKALRICIL